MGSGRLPGGHNETIAPGENTTEAAVFGPLIRAQRHPDRIDAVEIFGAQAAGDGIGATRNDRRVVDGERELRWAGALSLAEARGPQQQDQRP